MSDWVSHCLLHVLATTGAHQIKKKATTNTINTDANIMNKHIEHTKIAISTTNTKSTPSIHIKITIMQQVDNDTPTMTENATYDKAKRKSQ